MNRFSGRRWLHLLLLGGLTVGIIALLLRYVTLADIAAALASVGPAWLGASFLLYILSTTLRAARFQYLLRGRIRFPAMLRIVYLQNLANNLLPNMLGELSFVYLAKRESDISSGEAGATLVVARLFDLLAVFGLTVVALLLLPSPPSQFSTLLFWFGVFLALLFCVITVSLVHEHRVVALSERFAAFSRLDRISVVPWALRKMRQVIAALHTMREGRTLLVCSLVSLAVWGLAYAQVYILLAAMGSTVTFLTAALGTSLYRLASALPVYGIAGFGTVELTWSAAFVLLGMSAHDAIISGFAVHIIMLSYAVLLGVIASWLHSLSRA